MDTNLNEKLYQIFLKDFKKNHIRNDDVDLLPHHTLSVKRSLQGLNSTLRNLQSSSNEGNVETYTVKTLVEPYPQGYCFNGG